jgi:hypothetical protein
VQIVRELDLPASASWTFDHVDDLARYPAWMTLVHDAVATSRGSGDPPGAPAWIVELQAQVGPFARSKRLRMVRTVHTPDDFAPRIARFERMEVDGRTHAAWTLEATVGAADAEHDAEPGGSRLTMTLTYGGRLWTGAVLQRVLDDAVTRGSQTLLALAHEARPLA